MNEQLKTSDESIAVHPSPALKFVKGATKPAQARSETDQSHSDIDRVETKVQKRKPKPKKSKQQAPTTPEPDKVRHIYEPFSTRVRHDIKRRLKRLSHQREETGHAVCKVQHFVEEAILQWLAAQDEPTTAE